MVKPNRVGITLDEQDFRDLVAGKNVEKEHQVGPVAINVDIILADIGYLQILGIIRDQMVGLESPTVLARILVGEAARIFDEALVWDGET